MQDGMSMMEGPVLGTPIGQALALSLKVPNYISRKGKIIFD